MHPTKNVFLTTDIIINNDRMPDESLTGFENFQLTEDYENFLEFTQNDNNKATEDEKKTAKSFADTFPQSLGDIKEWTTEGGHNAIYEEWNDRATNEERFQTPVMNCLRYFPSFVEFEEEDRYKTIGNTCLLYDTGLEAWAVGMTGGGMDLSPDLLATFINLEKGVPLELAFGINRNYSAYISKETHEANCDLLAQAFLEYGDRMFNYALRLNPVLETETLKRHLKGLQKTL